MERRPCVVFDIDDTLYLERDYVRSGFRSVGDWARTELGLIDLGERAWRLFSRGARASIFDEVLGSYGLPYEAATIASLVGVYREHDPAIELLADARDCLERLEATHIVAALSDGPIQSQRAKARALGLDRWAAPILLTAELGDGFAKPAAAAFKLIEQRTGSDGRNCVYVADNPAKDFAGPKSLGWRTIRVRRPAGLHALQPSGSDVDFELADLAELPRVLDERGLQPSSLPGSDA